MLSLAAPWLLLGLAALALPVLLHLMNRQRPQRLRFSSLRFLYVARLPQEGRHRLQDLVLLCLRLALLALLVLAVARPRWQPPAAAAGAGTDAGTMVLVVDTSASMQADGVEDELRRQLHALLAAAGDRPLALVTSAGAVQQVVPPGSAAAALRAALASLSFTLDAGNHLVALHQAQSFLAGAEPELVLLSDFQQTDWQLAQNVPLPPDTRLTLIDVAPPRQRNVGISEVTSQALAPGGYRVLVQVRNYGNEPEQRQVTLTVGEKTTTASVSVPARDSRQVALLVEADGGERAVVVKLTPGDSYALDDSYYAWLGVAPPLSVLVVAPLRDEPDKAEEFFFLRGALQADVPGSSWRFQVQTVDAELFFTMPLEESVAVVLLGAAAYLREPDLAKLRRFVENGGTVLATPGTAAGHSFRNLARAGLLPVNFESVQNRSRLGGQQPFHIETLAPESMLAPVFGAAANTDLFLFPIFRLAKVKPQEQATELRVHLSSDSDDPLLLEYSLGRGRVFMTTFALDSGWSDLPYTTSFLPLVRELLQSAAPETMIRKVDCGTVVGSAVDTSRPGVVHVGAIPIEVNVSRQESSIDKADLVVLRNRFSAAAADAATLEPGSAAPAVELAPWLGLLAALLLLGELFYLYFHDHYRRETV